MTIMDIVLDRVRYLDELMESNVTGIYCEPHAIERYASCADLVVGAVLVPGGKAPVLIDRGVLGRMKKGSVIVDVCIDGRRCLIDRCPELKGERLFFFCQNGQVRFESIRVRPLL